MRALWISGFVGGLFLALMAAPALAPAQEGTGVRAFTIDSKASLLKVRLFRKGLLSVFSHDHLLVAQGIAGRILYNEDDVSQSSLQLSIPVESIEVDPSEERKRAGLSGEFAEDERREIRKTMLSEEYLDGARYPRIVATADLITGDPPQIGIALNLRIKQTEGKIFVPVRVTIEGDTLGATGEIRLRQSEFGVTPFSEWMGSLAVKDEILVQFDILAHEQP